MRRAFTLAIVVGSVACESPFPPQDGGVPGRDAGTQQSVSPPCLETSPSSIDFGEVENPLSAFQRIELFNRSTRTLLVHTAPRPGPFFISPLDASDLLLPAGGQRTVEVQFFANDALLHNGTIELTAGPDCSATIDVRGLGSGAVSMEPATLHYGFLEPGESKTLEVRLTNTRRTTVQVKELMLQERSTTTAYSASLPAVPFELAPLSSRTFSITATPPTDLTFDAELVAGTMFGVARTELRAIGGAPRAEVSPASIEVALATYEPWFRSPSWVQRDVRFRNVSTMGRSPFSRLLLMPPLATAEQLDGGPAPEVLIRADVTFDTGLGLDRDQSAAVPIRITPTRAGLSSYRVRFFTNDPVTPEHVVSLNVNAVTLGRCFLRVDPERELYLTPTPAGRARGTISFINMGPNRCVVDDPRFTAATSPQFSIVDALPQFIVEPGATRTLTIEGPRSTFLITGTFTFHVLNEEGDQQFIQLHVPP